MDKFYFQKGTGNFEKVEAKAFHGGSGYINRERIFPNHNFPFHMNIWELEPGASEGMHKHHEPLHKFRELYYFLEGEGEVGLDNETIKVSKGDSMLINPETDRGIRNVGSDILKVMIIWGM